MILAYILGFIGILFLFWLAIVAVQAIKIIIPIVIIGFVIYILCAGFSFIILHWIPITCGIVGFIIIRIIANKIKCHNEYKKEQQSSYYRGY